MSRISSWSESWCHAPATASALAKLMRALPSRVISGNFGMAFPRYLVTADAARRLLQGFDQKIAAQIAAIRRCHRSVKYLRHAGALLNKSGALLALAVTGFAAAAAQTASDKSALPWGGDPRAAPGLTYVASTPFFTEHYYESEDDGDESVDQGPVGGRTWDGRVNRAREQAAIPLLAPNEMANSSEAAVVARAAAAPYASQMRQISGGTIFAATHRAFAAIGEALEAYQQTPEEFSPFTSKYDAFLRGQTQLTLQELR